MFLGSLAASAYFGYYTLRYTTDQVEDLIDEADKPENQFPGSNVSCSSPGIFHSTSKYACPFPTSPRPRLTSCPSNRENRCSVILLDLMIKLQILSSTPLIATTRDYCQSCQFWCVYLESLAARKQFICAVVGDCHVLVRKPKVQDGQGMDQIC